jgi:taurine dioxygenase
MVTTIKLDQLTAKTVSTYGVVHLDVGKKLSPSEFLEMSRCLGKVVPFGLSKYRPGDFPREVTLLDNQGDGLTAAPSSFGEGWHQDSTFMPEPPEFTILHAQEVPRYGGETYFADTRPAFAALSREDREEILELRLEHSVQATYRISSTDAGRTLGEILRGLPVSSHPIANRNIFGEVSLCLSPLYTRGLLKPEVRPFFDRVLENVLKNQRAHEWKAGDVLAWDNRVVLHAASGYRGRERRQLLRTVAQDIAMEQ